MRKLESLHRTTGRVIVTAMLVGLLGACQGSPPPRPAAPVTPVSDWCRGMLGELDELAAFLGIGFAESRRIEDFPYLRVTRPLQGLREHLSSRARFDAWVSQLAQADRTARDTELAQLAQRVPDLPDYEAMRERVDGCRAALIEQELQSPATQARLIRNAEVADDYSTLARTLGLYPLTRFALQMGVDGYQQSVRELYAAPLPAGVPTVAWSAAGGERVALSAREVSGWIDRASDNALRLPEFSDAQWRALAVTHAPTLWVEQASRADRIGAPAWKTGQPALHVDTRQPTVYYRTGFAEFGRRFLPQISYVAWFPERPKSSAIDPYAGRFDGVIWRVTLGVDGLPLSYDTIHPCGCFHLFFTPRRVALRAPEPGTEAVLSPQAEVPDGPVAVRISSSDHMVSRVVRSQDVKADEYRAYALEDWQRLNLMPDGRGGVASLFRAEDGIVPGSERLERFYLWPSGVRSPGAMRSWGHHATAFIGRRHFDDPKLLCEVIACPSSLR